MTDGEGRNKNQPDEEKLPPTASFTGSARGPGTQIGQFRVERELGRGGMGVVYLAHDTNLDRPVAIKSLPPQIAENAELLSRLKREAKILASLNHPNIATIHEEVQKDGIGYLVLEYIAGDTLAERMSRGALTLEEALSIGLQVAEALSAAHSQSVIHRDLKPSNIKITPENNVKVLDFGIAKAVAGGPSARQTTTTEPGRILGTPAYMSPEQSRGKPTDKRCDIWSFGCVLYEMLTGRIAFEGQTASDTLANIINQDPDWHIVPQSTPTNIKVLLRRCLEKDLNKRLQDIGDARIEISETLDKTVSSWGDTPMETGRRQPKSWRSTAILCLICLFTGALATFMIMWGFRETRGPVASSVRQVALEPLPEGISLLMSQGGSIAVSPDGRYLVYVGVIPDGTTHLFLRDTTVDFQPRPIQRTKGACSPFFRPDGEWIGFFAEDELTAEFALKRVRVRGGMPEFICRVPPLPCGGCWSRDDHIVFSPIYHQSLATVAAFGDGKILEYPVALDPNNDEHGQLWPDILPDGKGIIYTVWGGDSRKDYRTMIKWKDIDKPQELLTDSSFARYVSATGQIIFMRQGSLQAVPFDVERPNAGVIQETPEVLIENLGSTLLGGSQFAFARNQGTLIYASGPFPLGMTEGELVWVDPEQPNATATALPQSKRYYDEWSRPRLSPDERTIAVTPADETNLLLYKFGSGYSRPFAVMEGWQGGAVWRPRPGNHLAFYGLGADSPPDIFWKPLESDGAVPELLLRTRNSEQPCSFSPDGKYLASSIHHVSKADLSQTSDIWIIEPETDKPPTEWTTTAHCSEWGADFSPDGKWIAYTSDELGQKDAYVREFPEGRTEKIGTGSEVMWGPDKQKLELFYRSGGQMQRVKIQTEPEFSILSREALFKDVYLTTAFPGHRNYDYSAMRKQFLMIRQVDERPTPLTQMGVEHNWFERLKRKTTPAKN